MNLKTGVSRKQSTSNFPKNEHFLPSDMHTCDYLYWLQNLHFSKWAKMTITAHTYVFWDLLLYLKTMLLQKGTSIQKSFLTQQVRYFCWMVNSSIILKYRFWFWIYTKNFCIFLCYWFFRWSDFYRGCF